MVQASKVVLVLMSTIALSGCGDGVEEFPTVKLDASQVATDIMAEFDSNSDGELSKSELKKSDGLMMMTKGAEMLLPELRLDQDSSGTISEAELASKFEACFGYLRQGYDCTVLYRGQPLEGATVTFVPESFMGDTPTASGETDRNGNCSIATADGMAGAIPGIYRVEITHPEMKIAAKYNTDSKTTVALDPTNPYANAGVPKFDIR